MIEYPKIETLYNRDPKTFKVDTFAVRLPEFDNVKRWSVTEKIDGTNIRVGLSGGVVSFGGRTDAAQMPTSLFTFLRETFTNEKMRAAFCDSDADVVLFGEGYGEKIQKGGGNYRSGVSFRLFDVTVGPWWLEPDAVANIAEKLGIETVPTLSTIQWLPRTTDHLRALIDSDGWSVAAKQDGGNGLVAEGIVARAVPMLLTRRGDRLIWKLKFRDF